VPSPAFKRVEELFHQAVALDPPERATFLEAACAGDTTLRAAVEDLLRHDPAGKDTGSFLTSPLAAAADQLRIDPPSKPDTGVGPPLPGIPGYEVLEERGRGGMGVVYRALQTGLNRIVALKMLLPESAADPALLARFRTEAEALARLHHPNIIPIYDIGQFQGRPYFTMEFVAGPNLAEWLDGRAQDYTAAARLVEVLARTMHAVHQAGIIHRDLKPANVLLAFNREPPASAPAALAGGSRLNEYIPKITDFGLAKDQTGGRRLTQSGMALGTPCYMAPEQARHREGAVGPGADIYALGAMLYEMLTGRPPFDAKTELGTIYLLINEEPLSPARLRPRLPADLVTICLKCLEKSPRRRYATAWDLAEDLRRFQAGEPICARPVGFVERSYRWCRRRPLVAGLLALLGVVSAALVVTLLLLIGQLRGEMQEEKREIVQLQVVNGVTALEEEDTITAVYFFTEALRLDPEGPSARNHRTRIATALRQSPRLLRRQVLDHPLFREALLSAALSADERSLAVAGAGGTVRVWDLETGESRDAVIEQSDAARRLSFRLDGHLLLTEQAGDRLRSWDLTKGEPRRIHEFAVHNLALAVLSDNGPWWFTLDGDGAGMVWDAVTSEPAGQFLPIGKDIRLAAVSPDGRRVGTVGPNNALTVWDALAGKPVGKPLLLPEDVGLLVFSPDGERLLTTGRNRTAQVWQVRTGALLSAWSRLDSTATHAQFSPDGRLVLLGDATGRGRVREAATGRALTPPVRYGVSLVWAVFHGGGKQVVTVSASGVLCFWQLPLGPEVGDAATLGAEGAAGDEAADHGRRRIELKSGPTMVANEATAAPLRPPHPGDGLVENAAFSPDGKRVAACEDETTVRVWDTATGRTLTPPLRHGGVVLYGAFSADGERLLTASDDRVARVWDAATGEVLAPPLRHDRPIERVFFRAGGDRACVVHEGGLVSTWDLSPDDRPVGELVNLVQEMAWGRGGRDR
jgi:serine/threonine protein kinase/WD40 repeat protein